MDENGYQVFGYIGSGISCIMYFPQVYLTLTQSTTEGLSIKTVTMNLLTHSFFLPYSLYFRLYPLMAANIICGVCDITIISVYFKNTWCPTQIQNQQFVEIMENEI